MAAGAALERPLPQYLEAERWILGAVINSNHLLLTLIEKGLKSEDFFLDQHKKIYEAMISLDEAHSPIDLLTLSEFLHRQGKIEAAGGAAYLAALGDGMPRIANVEHYVRIVKEKSLLRNIIHTADRIQQDALAGEDEADEVLDRAESLIFQLAEERVRAGFVGVKELVTESFERLHRILTEGRRITGLSTGYNELDKLTSGLQDSELIILAARPSMGKTALALNFAENIAVRSEEPRAVGIFSLEMSKESLLLRMLAAVAQIDAHKFRTGHLGRQDWERMSQALQRLSDSPLWIDDSGSATVVEIGAKARRLKRDKGLSLIIVDYLQLISARGKFSNRNEEVSAISRGLKALAKELKVPVVVLSQLTRAPEREDRKPQLADLRESGAIEQDADVVMFIHRPNFYNKDLQEDERRKAELIIAKQRNGPTDKLNYIFLEKFTRFEEAAPESWA
jgi:replicative DNA helicase